MGGLFTPSRGREEVTNTGQKTSVTERRGRERVGRSGDVVTLARSTWDEEVDGACVWQSACGTSNRGGRVVGGESMNILVVEFLRHHRCERVVRREWRVAKRNQKSIDSLYRQTGAAVVFP